MTRQDLFNEHLISQTKRTTLYYVLSPFKMTKDWLCLTLTLPPPKYIVGETLTLLGCVGVQSLVLRMCSRGLSTHACNVLLLRLWLRSDWNLSKVLSHLKLQSLMRLKTHEDEFRNCQGLHKKAQPRISTTSLCAVKRQQSAAMHPAEQLASILVNHLISTACAAMLQIFSSRHSNFASLLWFRSINTKLNVHNIP